MIPKDVGTVIVLDNGVWVIYAGIFDGILLTKTPSELHHCNVYLINNNIRKIIYERSRK